MFCDICQFQGPIPNPKTQKVSNGVHQVEDSDAGLSYQ